MRGVLRVTGLLLIAFPAAVYASGIYRCDTGGHIAYQDMPCAVGTGKNAKVLSEVDHVRAKQRAESERTQEQRVRRERERAAEKSGKAAAEGVLR